MKEEIIKLIGQLDDLFQEKDSNVIFGALMILLVLKVETYPTFRPYVELFISELQAKLKEVAEKVNE